MTTQNTPNSSEQYEAIKLGIDAHAQWYSVSRQVDGATPPFSFISLSPLFLRMGVSSLMNDIELACLLLPRGKG